MLDIIEKTGNEQDYDKWADWCENKIGVVYGLGANSSDACIAGEIQEYADEHHKNQLFEFVVSQGYGDPILVGVKPTREITSDNELNFIKHELEALATTFNLERMVKFK